MKEVQLADKLFSAYIRSRDKICKYCGVRPSSDSAHYINRRHKSIRWHKDNATGLCRPCHQKLEVNKGIHTQLVRNPDKLQKLSLLSDIYVDNETRFTKYELSKVIEYYSPKDDNTIDLPY